MGYLQNINIHLMQLIRVLATRASSSSIDTIPMQNLWLLSKIGCNSLLHIGLFATNERHFDVRVTDG